MHAAIRRLILARSEPAWDASSLGVPINQEDLAGTLLTFAWLPLDALARIGVRIARDAHNVPHVYGDTRADTMFGAGYATAQDRLFFMDVLRHTGRGRLTELIGPGEDDANVEADAEQMKIADYDEDELQAMIDRGREAAGPPGRVARSAARRPRRVVQRVPDDASARPRRDGHSRRIRLRSIEPLRISVAGRHAPFEGEAHAGERRRLGGGQERDRGRDLLGGDEPRVLALGQRREQ